MAEATVKLGMDVRPFEKGAEQAQTTITGISTFAAAKFRVVQELTSKALEQGMALLQSGFRAAVGELEKATQAAEAVNAIALQFENVYKSASKASQAIAGIQELSTSLHTTSAEALQAASTLASVGVQANQLRLAVGVLSNISAGSGMALGQLAKIYAESFASGSVSAEHMNQLVAAGIPIAQKAHMSAQELVSAFQKMGTTGGQYFSASADALETFDGKLLKIRETFQNLIVSVIRPFVDTLRPALDALASATGSAQTSTGTAANGMTKAAMEASKTVSAMDRVKEALKPVADIVLKTLQAVRPVVEAISARLGTLIANLSKGPDMIEEATGALSRGIASIGDFLKKLPQAASEFGEQIARAFDFLATAIEQGKLGRIVWLELMVAFKESVNWLTTNLAKGFLQVSAFLSSGVKVAGEAFQSSAKVVSELFSPKMFQGLANGLLSAFDTATKFLEDQFTKAVNTLKNLFRNSVLPLIQGGLAFAFQEAANQLIEKLGVVGKRFGLAKGGKTFEQFQTEATPSGGGQAEQGPSALERAKASLAAGLETLTKSATETAASLKEKMEAGGKATRAALEALQKSLQKVADGGSTWDAEGNRAELKSILESIRGGMVSIPKPVDGIADALKLTATGEQGATASGMRRRNDPETIVSSLARIGGGGGVSMAPMVTEQQKTNRYLERIWRASAEKRPAYEARRGNNFTVYTQLGA